MKELSLYILDISQNSLKAGAKNVHISLLENFGTDKLVLKINDDGCGMSEEMVERVRNPFFTTRKTRKVGLGIPFLELAATQTGGYIEIVSRPEDKYPDSHGTCISAVFHKDSIDFPPLGDIISTITVIIQGYPDVDYIFRHVFENGEVRLDTKEIRQVLGDEISLADFEVLNWIKEYLEEAYNEITDSTNS